MSLETVKSFQGWAVSLATNLSYFGADLDHGSSNFTDWRYLQFLNNVFVKGIIFSEDVCQPRTDNGTGQSACR